MWCARVLSAPFERCESTINNKTEHFVQQSLERPTALNFSEIKIGTATVMTVMEQNITFIHMDTTRISTI